MSEPLLINSFTTGRQTSPAVAMAPDGSFVVIWSSTGQVGEDAALFAQRFSPEGEPLGVRWDRRASGGASWCPGFQIDIDIVGQVSAPLVRDFVETETGAAEDPVGKGPRDV